MTALERCADCGFQTEVANIVERKYLAFAIILCRQCAYEAKPRWHRCQMPFVAHKPRKSRKARA